MSAEAETPFEVILDQDAARRRTDNFSSLERQKLFDWLTRRVLEGRGNVEFCLTEGSGKIGLFLRGEPECRGIGETVDGAVRDAMRRSEPRTTTTGND